MNTKDVSIIMPIYNVEKYVAECLNSVISQTYDHSNIECIIVDDCTPDLSMVIVNDIIGNYDGEMTFNIIRHEQNQGLSAARNTGIEAATGKYIYFIDSDDYIYPNTISVLLSATDRNVLDIVIGNNYNELSCHTDLKIRRTCDLKNFNSLYFGKTNKIQALNTLIKRNIVIDNRLRFPIDRYFEDIVFTSQLYKCVKTVRVLPDCTYYYRINNTGIMHKSTKLNLEKSFSDYLFALNILADPNDNQLRVGKNARSLQYFYFLYDMLMHGGDTLANIEDKERDLSIIRYSLIKYNLRHFRFFLFLHSLLGLKPIANIIIKNVFLRRNIDIIFCIFLYPALWADKLHKLFIMI